MQKYGVILSAMYCLIMAEPPIQVGVKPTNVIGNPEQHTSFSFVRPGLTQTSFAFAGPSSHQSFAASIGNPQLVQKVQPSISHALAQRNPGLGACERVFKVLSHLHRVFHNSRLLVAYSTKNKSEK